MMAPLELSIFGATLLLACGMPGPTTLALASGSLGRGSGSVMPMIPGLIAGECVWMAGASLGMAGLAHAHAGAFALIRYGGALYLLFLAWKSWRSAEVEAPNRPGTKAATALSGVALSLGNPKTMLFYLALLPSVIDLQAMSPVDFLVLELTVVTITGAIFLAYTLAAARVRRAVKSPALFAGMGRITAIFMLLAAALVAFR